MNLAHWLVDWWNRETVAILGPRASGKTSIYNYLVGELSAANIYTQTKGPDKRAGKHNQDLRLYIRKGMDLPGSQNFYPDWKREFDRANRVLYVFDVTKIPADAAYVDRVKEDAKRIRQWDPKPGRQLTIVGTHLDLDDREPDDILDLDAVVALKTRTAASRAVVGSLLSNAATSELLARAFGRRAS